MRTLILFRHGKSNWDSPAGDDHGRPLNKRGVRASRTMGRFLRVAGQVPSSAVTSTAVRARTTLALASEAGEWQCPSRQTDDLYDSSPGRVLDEIQREPDDRPSLLLVGHEPTWSEMVTILTGARRVRFPTAAMARIDLAVSSWADVHPDGGELIWLVPPRILVDGGFVD